MSKRRIRRAASGIGSRLTGVARSGLLGWGGDQARGTLAQLLLCVADRALQRLESHLLDRNAVLGQLGLVGAQQVVVGFAHASQLVLQVFDGTIL